MIEEGACPLRRGELPGAISSKGVTGERLMIMMLDVEPIIFSYRRKALSSTRVRV
jgi:hypothetical protein